jgi:hypothetical protein
VNVTSNSAIDTKRIFVSTSSAERYYLCNRHARLDIVSQAVERRIEPLPELIRESDIEQG